MRWLLFLFAYLYAVIGYSQKSDISVLIKDLETYKGVEKSDKLHEISLHYYESNWDSVEYYSEKQLLLSKEINYNLGEIQALTDLGNVHDIKGDFNKSKQTFQEALTVKIKDKKPYIEVYKGLANLYLFADKLDSADYFFDKAISLATKLKLENNVKKLSLNKAVVLSSKGEFEKAVTSFTNDLDYFENQKDSVSLYIIFNGIGNAYFELLDNEQSLLYHRKALLISKNSKNKNHLGSSLGNIANIYGNMKKYDSSAYYFNKCHDVFKESGYEYKALYVKTNLLNLYAISGEHDKLLSLCEELEQENLAPESRIILLYSKSIAQFEKGLTKDAEITLNSAIEIAENLDSETSVFKLYSRSVYNYLAINNMEIYDRFVKYDSILNNRFSKESKEVISNLNKKYELKEKEKQIVEQQLQNQKEKYYKFAALGGVGFLLLFGAGTFIYSIQNNKHKEIKKQQEFIEIKQNLTKLGLSNLNNQINSHDYKNTLIAALNEVQEKAPASYQHINNLLKLTESALYNDSFTDLLKNQINQIKGLVELANEQLFEKVTLNVYIDTDENKQIPRLLLKNLIENSIKHGIKGTDKDSEIAVSIFEENDFIKIKVKDNGRGFKNMNAINGKGISVYQELFSFFNSINSKNAKIEIKKVEIGALVEVEIPVDYKYIEL